MNLEEYLRIESDLDWTDVRSISSKYSFYNSVFRTH